MKHLFRIVWAVLVAVLLATPMWGAQQEKEIELTRLAIQRQRDDLVTQFMEFNYEEGQAFWPVYGAYRAQMVKIGDRTQKLIIDYAENRDNLSHQKALAMLDESLKIEEAQLKLKRKYVKEFKKVLSPKKVVRFFQLDNKFNAMVNYNLSGSIPLVK